MKHIYLDYAATTPVDKRVLDDMLPYFLEDFGNPASSNLFGQKASNVVRVIENNIKNFFKADDFNIVFTSGATESINMCLKSLFFEYGHERNVIITSKTEHKAVLEVCSYLESIGAEIIYLPVDRNGNISIDDLEKTLSDKTLAVALMAVNNETGVIHDVESIGELCSSRKVKFICDSTQTVGKVNFSVDNIDYFVLSAHKIYGPKGVGAILFKKNNLLTPLIHGGGQQNNYRSGTLNVSGIVGLGSAIKLLEDSYISDSKRILTLKNKFESELLSTGKIEILSINANRSPYISNVHFINSDIDSIKLPLQAKISFSSGSACTSKIIKPSHAITAMGYSDEEAGRCLRFSFGRNITESDIDIALQEIKKLL